MKHEQQYGHSHYCLHLPLTQLMLQKQPLSLIHWIHVVVLPLLRQGKTSLAACQQGRSLIYLPLCLQSLWKVPHLIAFRVSVLQMTALCKVCRPNSISCSKQTEGAWWGIISQSPGPSLTLRRAAGRNQEGQDMFLKLMRATTIYLSTEE